MKLHREHGLSFFLELSNHPVQGWLTKMILALRYHFQIGLW